MTAPRKAVADTRKEFESALIAERVVMRTIKAGRALRRKEMHDLALIGKEYQGKALGVHYGNFWDAGANLEKMGLVEQKGNFLFLTDKGKTALKSGEV